jgi:hypothetical protein
MSDTTTTATTTVDPTATVTKNCIVKDCAGTFEVLVKRGKGKPRQKCYTCSPQLVKKPKAVSAVVEAPLTPTETADTASAVETEAAPVSVDLVLAAPVSADDTTADVFV